MVANIFWPSMSFGEASACGGGLAEPAGADCWASEAAGSPGQMMARQAAITNGIRIPGSALTARAAPQARQRIARQGGRGPIDPLSPTPSSLSEREDNQSTGILRHALEGLAIQRDKLVGHQAAPA